MKLEGVTSLARKLVGALMVYGVCTTNEPTHGIDPCVLTIRVLKPTVSRGLVKIPIRPLPTDVRWATYTSAFRYGGREGESKDGSGPGKAPRCQDDLGYNAAQEEDSQEVAMSYITADFAVNPCSLVNSIPAAGLANDRIRSPIGAQSRISFYISSPPSCDVH